MSSLSYLNKYLVKYKWLLILGTICIIISNIFFVEMPVVVKDAVNEIEDFIKEGENPSRSGLMQIGLIAAGTYVLLAILKGIFLFYTRQTIIIMSRKIEFDLKSEIYEKYQALSFNFYKKNATGDLMNRISEDVSMVRMYLGPGIMYTVNLFFLFVLTLYQMLMTNPTLTMYVLIPLPLMSVLIYFVSNLMNRRSTKVQEQQSILSTIVQESFSGIRVIKAHNQEKESNERFSKESDTYKKRSVRLAAVDSFFMPTIMLLIGISTILTVYIGSLQSLVGDIRSGEIAEFVIYVNILTWPFASVGWVTSIIQRAAASQTRINEFMNVPVDMDPEAGKEVGFEKEIRFRNVGITYDNSGVTALQEINLTIKRGETVGIIGRTGSGKSSLATLLLRQIDPTEGNIEVDGENLTHIQLKNWRERIGYVPQDHFLFSDSIRNNILFGVDPAKTPDEKLFRAAQDACIHDTVMGFPDKYDTLLGERGINLSGGQKQRVSIARALIRNPEILILDDCLSAVDTETEEHILKAIRRDLDAKTSIIISHRISSIKYADRIIVLEDGRMVEEGKHEELLQKKGAYYRIFRKQELMEDIAAT